jgi:hypothetical protein
MSYELAANPDPNTTDATDTLEFVGLDIGHGECAAVAVRTGPRDLPKILEYRGQKSVLSVVAEHPALGTLIGEEAVSNASDSARLWRRYKSQNVHDDTTRIPTELFIRRWVSEMRSKRQIGEADQTKFLVGCPSGWKPEVRADYARLLRRAGLESVEVISESRAAFLASRDSGDLRVAPDLLADTVLIVDMGSSTTDFTAVSRLQEQPLDFGDNALGAGLIDKAILERVVAGQDQASEMRKIFAENSYYEGVCELLCRRAKERYFSAEEDFAQHPELAASGGNKKLRPGMYFEAEVSSADMQTVLAQRLPELGNRTWVQAYRQGLEDAKSKLTSELGTLPNLIILTGGASRMGFALQVCQEIFPAPTIVVRGKEPEYAIATGLALAGRVDVNSRRFMADVESLLASRALHDCVDFELSSLVDRVAANVVEQLPDQFIMPAIEQWKLGRIRTLKGVTEQVKTQLEDWLNAGEGRKQVIQTISQWFREISPHVERLTQPICEQYGIPSSAFRLDDTVLAASNLIDDERDPLRRIYGELASVLSAIVSILIGIIVTIVSATVAGPIGFLIVTVISFVAGKALGAMLQEPLLNADLPLLMRQAVLSGLVRERLTARAPEMAANIANALSEPRNRMNLVDNLVKPIALEMQRDAERAALLVR